MFSTTATTSHSTPLPPGASPAKLISLLQGYEFFIKCDPHMTSYHAIPTPTTNPEPAVPKDRTSITPTGDPAKCYEVTDKVAALPAGIWSSDVVSIYEFINITNGVFVRIRSPMNVVMETAWLVKQVEGSDGDPAHELEEDVVINCSRFLIGFVQNTCESGWNGIHGKMMTKLNESSSDE